MGGDVKCYVDDWESREKTHADIFDNTAKVTPDQKLGVSQKAYEALMRKEEKWEALRDSGGPYPKTSPLQHATFSKPEGMDSLQFKPTEIPPLDFKR